MDINDLILAELCRSEKLKFVTHDADFASLDVPILTANRRLLAK
jgi:predicted nucleic acid-binding protein